MTRDLRRRVDEIFDAALDLPAADRPAYVREAAGDDRVAAEVLALLQAHERTGLLERPVPTPVAEPQPERRIGSYLVVGELGRGGMGVVYAAERDDGQFHRRVAIKVLRADADPSLEARVVAERQILASLDHPNIARLLDGGVTSDGRPFLVMEYVDGLPIDLYADRMRLTVEERIRLFVTAAEAVQHAHRNLVVHRDLKPTNILVTSRGEVKLLDFGIAKLLNPALGPRSAPMTMAGQRALTPEYASPEQIRGEPLSTATDVYSLGVVLYRLLTGRHPYRFGNDSMASVVDVISVREPRRPSETVLREGEADEPSVAGIAEARRTTAGRLAHRLKGDLDAIVLNALRKEPGDRYGSPELLVRDLERHLEGEPVEARRGARGYQVRTFLRRNRYALAAAVLIVASLVGGAGAALWQARIASEERDRTEEALAQSSEMAGFLMSLFSVPNPLGARPDEITASDLLRRGLVRVEELESHPLLQSRMLEVIANVHGQLGQFDQAVALHRRSLVGRLEALGTGSPEVARAMNELGLALRELAEFDEARSLHDQALEIQRHALGPADTALATTLGHLAWIEFDLTRRVELQQRMLEIREAALEPGHPARLDILLAIANTERGLGHYDRAVAYLERALREGQQAHGPDDALASTPLAHLADILVDDLGQPARAEAHLRRALAIQEAERGPDDPLLIHALHSLGNLLGNRGDHEEAEQLLRRAVEINARTLGPDHPRSIGSTLNIAVELGRQGRHSEADSIFRRVIRGWTDARGSSHPSVATARTSHAHSLAQAGRLDEAEAEVRRALAIRAEGLGARGILVGLTLTQLGDVLRLKGDLEAAARTYRESRDILLENLEPQHPQVLDVEERLAELGPAVRTAATSTATSPVH